MDGETEKQQNNLMKFITGIESISVEIFLVTFHFFAEFCFYLFHCGQVGFQVFRQAFLKFGYCRTLPFVTMHPFMLNTSDVKDAFQDGTVHFLFQRSNYDQPLQRNHISG